MKLFRSALALAISLSLVLLSPGGTAWAQFAEAAARPTVPASGAASAAAGSIHALPSAAVPMGTSSLSLPSLNSTLAAPSALIPSAAVPVVAAPAAAVLPSAALPVARAAALPSASAAASAPVNGAAPATAIEGVRRELPDFSKMGTGDSKEAAGTDFLSRVGELFHKSAPSLAAVPAASNGAASSGLSKATSQSRADAPSRVASPRPEARSKAGAVALFGALGLFGGASVAGGAVLSPLLTLPLVIFSLILHEIGHAKVAAKLGDPTAALEGRASLNPLKWFRHVDFNLTVLMPVATFLASHGTFALGSAKPVEANEWYFKNPTRGMAWTAFAGPAVNLALAVFGTLAYTGAVAAGVGALGLGILTHFIFINVLLGLFNLTPIRPFDGSHILAHVAPGLSAKLGRVYSWIDATFALMAADAAKWLSRAVSPEFGVKVGGIIEKGGVFLPFAMVALLGGGLFIAAAAAVTHMLIGLSVAATGVQLAGAALPAMAAMGMALGSFRGVHGVQQLTAQAAPAGPSAPGAAAAAASQPVDLVVVFSGKKSLAKDLHLTAVDPRAANYVQAYEGVQRSLLAELNSVGLSPDALAGYNATPIASYRRINAATIRLDSSKVSEFEAALRAQGHKVYPNRRIVIPAPIVSPEGADPEARNPVSMAENLKITKADAVQDIASKRWGKPDLNPWQRLKAAIGLEAAPQPNIGVVDSGADTTHPLLRRVKDVKNATSGENIDDIGHGSWVTSMVLNYAPWAKNVTHYKTFLNGGATTDDILKALTMAANDGNLVISNSWGDDEGDPNGPDALLVKKLASEGHIMVFAAGNAGPGKNTVGSPAIVQYKDPATGAIRVVAVAATDRSKKVAYFSSRGPASPKTKGQDGVPHRPDLAAVGYNTEGAWPAKLGDADRTDAEQGPLKAISGTSMSTPSVAGAIALLAIMFGVTSIGPKLDAIVNAVMATLEKTGKNGPDDEGEGFINVTAAYELLYKQFNPGGIPPTAVARFRQLKSDAGILSAQTNTGDRSVLGGDMSIPPMDDRVFGMISSEMAANRRAMDAMAAEYPGIAHHAAGPLARAWARLTGRAPVPAHVAEYRRLSAKIEDNEYRRREYMRSLNENYSVGVHEEMLEYYENNIEPEFTADNAAYGALLRNYPDVAYQSAGAVGRFWMRLTGRGPKA